MAIDYHLENLKNKMDYFKSYAFGFLAAVLTLSILIFNAFKNEIPTPALILFFIIFAGTLYHFVRYVIIFKKIDKYTEKKDKMKIICFRGAPKTGKSNIIRKILTEVYDKDIKILCPKLKGLKKRREFSLCFKTNESKIGICSLGDSKNDLNDFLIPLKNEDCSLIICACHPEKSETHKFIEEEFRGNKIKFIDCKNVGKNKKKQEIYWSKKVDEFKRII